MACALYSGGSPISAAIVEYVSKKAMNLLEPTVLFSTKRRSIQHTTTAYIVHRVCVCVMCCVHQGRIHRSGTAW